jgi:hypothetical protein
MKLGQVFEGFEYLKPFQRLFDFNFIFSNTQNWVSSWILIFQILGTSGLFEKSKELFQNWFFFFFIPW